MSSCVVLYASHIIERAGLPLDAIILFAGEIKGGRPIVPRRVKCQYVVNMSITCMLKKCHQRDGKFPSHPPLKAPLLIKHSMGLFK